MKNVGEEEWLEEKHQTKCKRRSWRKLHLGPDLVGDQIACSDLTTDNIDDPTALPGPVGSSRLSGSSFLADDACVGSSTRDLLAVRFGATLVAVIPPSGNTAFSPNAAQGPTVRDRNITHIKTHGRMNRQKETGYNQCS